MLCKSRACLEHGDSSRSQVAVLFVGFAFMIVQFGELIANNGLSGGMNISSLLPRYFTIRPGHDITLRHLLHYPALAIVEWGR